MQSDVREKAIRFLELIDEADSIAIMGHMRPDGDCVGSTLGLYNYITENYEGKRVDVYLEEFSSDFNFLKASDKVNYKKHDEIVYDLAVSIDASDMDRHGEFSDIFKKARISACIDHHVSNEGFGDFCYIDPDASSACEALSDLLDMDKLSKNTAECIYLGIVHDTGVFKYSSTRRKTMELAGLLLEKGVDSAYIIDGTFYKKTYKQNLLMASCLLESKLYLDKKAISAFISTEMFKEYDCSKLDTEGIVEQLRLTDGVEVAIFVYQLDDSKYKFSLRSKTYVDVSKIASAFGGGGHVRAAGFETDLFYEDAISKVLDMVKEQL